jgi:soluble lytic murein transglycosylase-like protein
VDAGLPVIAFPHLPTVQAHAEFYFGVPAPVPAILAQITQESGFKADAISFAGAVGLMQLMPSTSKWAAQTAGFGISQPFDPAWNIRTGIWYDRWLYDRVRAPASKCDRWLFTLASYNGGEGWTRKRQALSANPGVWAVTGIINPGIAPANQAENQRYGPRILYTIQPRYATFGPLVCKEAM